MLYIIFLMLPRAVLADLGIIEEENCRFFIILPPDAAGTMLQAGFATVPLGRLIFGFVYLLALSAALCSISFCPASTSMPCAEAGV